MLVNFESLSDNSKVWVYQCNRELTKNEIEIIVTKIEIFVAGWKRHGKGLKASYQIKHNQFIILAVDEDYSQVSGCSIDSSVNLMKQFERAFNVDLTNRLNVSFRINNTINVVNLSEFKNFIKLGKITGTTVVFNNMITTKNELSSKWEVTADKSWHNQFLIS
ncbi:MAG: ABC transporter ATPase [Lutibacter sp.]|nr:ABC transporter ATPase [Lutibacter sp.]